MTPRGMQVASAELLRLALLASVLCASQYTVSASFWPAREEPCERCMRGVGLLSTAFSGVNLDALVSEHAWA